MLTKTLLHTLLATLAVRQGLALPVESIPSEALPGLTGLGPLNQFESQLESSDMEADLKSKVEKAEIVNVDKGVITPSKIQELRNRVNQFMHRVQDLFDDGDESKDQFGRRNSSPEDPFVEAQAFLGTTQDTGQVLFRGPLHSIEVFPGDYSLRGIKVKNISGNETIIGTATSSPKATSPGRFTFDDKERLKTLVIHTADGGKVVSGIDFTTTKGHSYSVRCNHPGHHSVEKKVGSGIIGQIRAVVGDGKEEVPALLGLGIDMIDEIESIKMVEVKYDGFDNTGERPPDKGESMIAGSQILDNRNSTVQQSFMFSLSKAISKSYSFMLQATGQVGLDMGVSSEVKVPIIAKATLSGMTHWSLALTAAATFTYTATISQGAMFTVQCPPGKFCEAESVFNTFRIDTIYHGRFEIVTKNGARFHWWRSDKFTAADVTDLKLVVNQYDTEPSAKAPNAAVAPIISNAAKTTATSSSATTNTATGSTTPVNSTKPTATAAR